MLLIKHLLVVSLGTSLLLSSQSNTQKSEMKAIVKMGERSSTLLLQTLSKNMKKSLKEGKLLKTFDFCSHKAYTLTQKVNKRLPKGVHVRRITQKYRSPANRANLDEVKILNIFQTMKDADVVLPKYIIQKIDTNRFNYYTPIIINNKVCLKCHGDLRNHTDIKKAIALRYPLDKATHYKMGDLRGAIVVSIDKSIKK